MARRRHISAKMRKRIWEADPACPFCGEMTLDPDLKAERIEVSHTIPLGIDPDRDDERNMRIAHYECHRKHTHTVDVPMIAKCKRVEKKHTGNYRKPRHIVPGSKASKWRKPLNKPAVLRTRREEA